MPLYEYQCNACGHRFEVIQKFSDAPLERCPKCEGVVRKLQSAPAFQFKGSGWYVTDYARKDQAASKTEDGPKETASADKDLSKTEKTGKTDKTDKTDKTEKSAPAANTPTSTTKTT